MQLQRAELTFLQEAANSTTPGTVKIKDNHEKKPFEYDFILTQKNMCSHCSGHRSGDALSNFSKLNKEVSKSSPGRHKHKKTLKPLDKGVSLQTSCEGKGYRLSCLFHTFPTNKC